MKLLQKESIVAAVVKDEDDPRATTPKRDSLLIIGGSPDRAKLVSYNPVVGTAVSIRTGEEIGSHGDSLHARVQPREAIFITSRETFKLKRNQIGICFGRVINAHHSLMIDANFIDPGYAGKLHCVLRNFGENASAIDLIKTPIMKIVIFELDDLNAEKESSPQEGIARTVTQLKEQQISRQRMEKRRRWIGAIGSLLLSIALLYGVSAFWPNAFQGNGLLQSVVTIVVFFLAQATQSLWAPKKGE